MWGLLVGLRTTVASYAVLFLNLSHVFSLGLRKLQRAKMAFEKKGGGGEGEQNWKVWDLNPQEVVCSHWNHTDSPSTMQILFHS